MASAITPLRNTAIPKTYAAATTGAFGCVAARDTSGSPMTLQNACAATGPARCPVRRNANAANHPKTTVYVNCAATPRAAAEALPERRLSSAKWWMCARPKRSGEAKTARRSRRGAGDEEEGRDARAKREPSVAGATT